MNNFLKIYNEITIKLKTKIHCLSNGKFLFYKNTYWIFIQFLHITFMNLEIQIFKNNITNEFLYFTNGNQNKFIFSDYDSIFYHFISTLLEDKNIDIKLLIQCIT